SHPRQWKTWRSPVPMPDPLLPGDFVAVMNREHHHSGIVRNLAFGLMSEVINLPGPTTARSFLFELAIRAYDPNQLSDVISVPTWMWRRVLGFNFVARPLQ